MGLELVRDNVANVPWRDEDQKRYLRPVVDFWEHRQLLVHKLLSEVGEFLATANAKEILEEAADIYEVLMTFLNWHGLTRADLDRVVTDKLVERGGFSKGLVYERS